MVILGDFRGKNFWVVVRIRGKIFWVVSIRGKGVFLVRIHGKCVFVGSHKGPFFVIRKFGRFLVVGNVGVVILVRTIYI